MGRHRNLKIMAKESRKHITEFLSEILIRTKLSAPGTHWAKEVTLDCGTTDVRRIDFLHFAPKDQMSVAGLEHGIFTAYEVKSCKADFESGFGRNAEGDVNFFVTTAKAWNEIKNDFSGRYAPEWSVLVAVPKRFTPGSKAVAEWILDPDDTPTDDPGRWRLERVWSGRPAARKRSLTELLFLMMRARRSC